MTGVRALPLLVAAALAVLTLKLFGMASGEGWALKFTPPAIAASDVVYRPVAYAHEQAARSQAQGDAKVAEPLTTGSTPPKKPEPTAPEAATPEAGQMPVVPPSNALQNSDSGVRSTPGERAVLEKLTDRRTELEEKAKDIEMRDSLLQAAEKRIEARIKELETLETRITAAKPEGALDGSGAAAAPDTLPEAKIKDLVVMYENMRPKDAARIFDDLNTRVLVSVVKTMNPRKMGDILAKMKPEAAQRLTVELAGAGRVVVPAQALPQIQGIPTQP